jgi:hypothetical protein
MKEKAEQAKAALSCAARMHPNHPMYGVLIKYEGAVASIVTPCFSPFRFLLNLTAFVFSRPVPSWL